MWAAFTGSVDTPVAAAGATASQVRTPTSTLVSSISPPDLPLEVYLALLNSCVPAWDPTDRNIYTTDGFCLNDVDRATRTSFVASWQVDAWPRWRWEADCLRIAFTPAITRAGGAAGSVGRASGTASNQESTLDPTTDPLYPLVYSVAIARGADAALAEQIAAYVVTKGSVEDFLNGVQEDVAHGEYKCLVRSAACPLVPEARQIEVLASSTDAAPRKLSQRRRTREARPVPAATRVHGGTATA